MFDPQASISVSVTVKKQYVQRLTFHTCQQNNAVYLARQWRPFQDRV